MVIRRVINTFELRSDQEDLGAKLGPVLALFKGVKRILRQMIQKMTPFLLALLFVSAVASFSGTHPKAGNISYPEKSAYQTTAQNEGSGTPAPHATASNSSYSFDPVVSLQRQMNVGR